MRILILSDGIPSETRGGAELVAWDIAKSLVSLGEEVSVITTTRKLSGIVIERREGMDIYTITSNYHRRWRAYLSLYNPQVVKEVRKIIEIVRPDIIHAHNIHYYISYYCLKLAKQSGAKVFLTAHDVMSFHYGKLSEFIDPNGIYSINCPKKFNYRITFWQQIKKYKKRFNPFRNMVIRHYLNYADKIFAVSNALKEALNQNGIQNVAVLNNGVDVEKWSISPTGVESFKGKYGLNNKKIVLFGGRLSMAKGGHQSIFMLEKVFKILPEIRLLILGKQDSYTYEMLKLAKKKKLDQALVFAGWLTGHDLKTAYHCATVSLVPSICFDSFPTIILEAMACGKPVVGTCYGGAPELIANNVTGYVVNPFNTEEMAGKVIDLLENSEKAEKFGRAGYERVKTNFNLEDKVREYLIWYEKLSNYEN